MPRPLIIDTDPGIDDALAIMLAAASPEVRILALTAVGGNVGIEHTSANAASLADLIGLDCEVGIGAARPLIRQDREAVPEVHGANGFGGFELAPSSRELRPAVPLLYDIITASPEPVTIAAIGPLTNIALLLEAHPDVAGNIERIVMMGGGFLDSPGNKTSAAEFNFYFDPDAAARVFESGIPLTMVGLNVTNKARVGLHHLTRLIEVGGPVSAMVTHMMKGYESSTQSETGEASQHDSVALAALIDPTLITTQHLPVAIETEGRHTAGMSVVDLRGVADANCDVAISLDLDRFRALLDERLATLALTVR